MSDPGCILTTMQMTKHLLEQAWHEIAAGSDLLDDAMLPPIGTSRDEYGRYIGDPGSLFLTLDEDGTVRGYHGPYRNIFSTRDLDEVLYLVTEEAVRHLAEPVVLHPEGRRPVTDTVTGQAELLDRINPAWGSRFRGGGMAAEGMDGDGSAPQQPCGHDPLERFAWIAETWRQQEPYTNLAFFRGEGVNADEIALLHGADPEQVAAGTSLSDVRNMGGTGPDHWESEWQTYCFGQAGDWAFLMYHETAPGAREDWAALSSIGVKETVCLNACSAKAIYTFDYMRDGRRVDDDWGVLELIWYDCGRAPYYRGGQLDFLNRDIRRAELDHPELTEFELYFHALETSLGLQLPRRDIQDGTVRAAQWARSTG